VRQLCPSYADGAHRIEDSFCACGYEFRVPPICVEINVTLRSETLIDEGFNCEDISVAIAALLSAADKLERLR
jgi:hypothetical protein